MTELVIRYHNYSFFELGWRDLNLFIDPAFSEFEDGEWRLRHEVKPCDYVFITHRHFDHFLDSIEVMEHSGAVMVASPGLCKWTQRELGLKKERFLPLGDGEALSAYDLRVEAFRIDHRGYVARWVEFASHPSMLLPMLALQARAPRAEHGQGFVFQFGDTCLWFCSEGLNDVTDLEYLESLARDLPPQIIIAAADLDYEEALAEAIEVLRPRTVLLHHPHDPIYHAFGIRRSSLSRFAQAIHRRLPSVEVIGLKPGSRYEPAG